MTFGLVLSIASVLTILCSFEGTGNEKTPKKIRTKNLRCIIAGCALLGIAFLYSSLMLSIPILSAMVGATLALMIASIVTYNEDDKKEQKRGTASIATGSVGVILAFVSIFLFWVAERYPY